MSSATTVQNSVASGNGIIDPNADWSLVFDAALQVGDFASLDDIFHRALDAWLGQLAPTLRWEIAIRLYTNNQISTGRGARAVQF